MDISKILREQILLETNPGDLSTSVGNALASSSNASSLFSKHIKIEPKREIFRLQGFILVSCLRPPSVADFTENNRKFTIYAEDSGGGFSVYKSDYTIYFYTERNIVDNKNVYFLMNNHNSYMSENQALMIDNVDFDKLLKNSNNLSPTDSILPLNFGTKKLTLSSQNLYAQYALKNKMSGEYYRKSFLTGGINEVFGGVYFYIRNISKSFQQK